MCGEAQRGRVQARHVWRTRLWIDLAGIARVSGGELVLGIRFQHSPLGCEAAQRIAVDGVLTGELLIFATERAMQVGQHEPLQLVPDLPFPGHVKHGSFGHAPYGSCPARPRSACPHLVHGVSASCALYGLRSGDLLIR